MNNFFGYNVVEKIKLISFEDERKVLLNKNNYVESETNDKYQNRINDVKNEKIKKSLIALSKVFRKK